MARITTRQFPIRWLLIVAAAIAATAVVTLYSTGTLGSSPSFAQESTAPVPVDAGPAAAAQQEHSSSAVPAEARVESIVGQPATAQELPVQNSTKTSDFPTTEELASMGVKTYNFSWGWGEYIPDEKAGLITYSDDAASATTHFLLQTLYAAGAWGDVPSASHGGTPVWDDKSRQTAKQVGERLLNPERLDRAHRPTPRPIYAVVVEPYKFHGPRQSGVDFSATFTITFEGEHGREIIRLLAKVNFASPSVILQQLREL